MRTGGMGMLNEFGAIHLDVQMKNAMQAERPLT